MKASLDDLKALLQRRTVKEAVPFTLLPSGIPKGAITGICGSGKTEFTLKFLAENPDLKIAWIEDAFSIYPTEFIQKNVDLKRVVFVDARDEVGSTALEVLRAQYFHVVVIYSELCDLKTLRRMQIASEKANASVIWLTNLMQNSWPVGLQVQIHREEGCLISTIIRQRL